MQNFFIDEKFYSELEDYVETLDDYKEDFSDMEDDWSIEATETEQKPVVELNIDWIMERIEAEQFPEDDDERVYNKVKKLISENVNFEAIAAAMPKLYYTKWGKGSTFLITKEDVLDCIKPHYPNSKLGQVKDRKTIK